MNSRSARIAIAAGAAVLVTIGLGGNLVAAEIEPQFVEPQFVEPKFVEGESVLVEPIVDEPVADAPVADAPVALDEQPLAAEVRFATAAAAAAAAAAPTLSVSPRDGLSPTGHTITVTGRGFDPTRNGGVGVYVVFGPKEADYATNADTFRSAKWVRPGATPSAGQAPLAADGSFTTTIDVVATYSTQTGRQIDCRAVACSILTMAAHGVPDRSQDTQIVLSFAASGPGTTAPRSPVSTPGASPSPAAPSSGAGATSTASAGTASVRGATASRGGSTASASDASSGSRGAASLAQTGTTTQPLVLGGLAAIVVGAALVVGAGRAGSGTVRSWGHRARCS